MGTTKPIAVDMWMSGCGRCHRGERAEPAWRRLLRAPAVL